MDFDFLNQIKGFMDDKEVIRLHEVALEAAEMGPMLEIGSYCGRSAVILGTACRERESQLYTIDHHRGSEEQQPGEEYFDPELYDQRTKGVNTLPFLRRSLERADLEEWVVPIVSSSTIVGRMWQTPLSMVFIDGGHSYEAALNDYMTWAPHIIPGGYLVIHDIFMDPEKGGQAPRMVYEKVLADGGFTPLEMTLTLGVLKRN
ncbi:MAG: class I SAM-dependent methyltransferase [Desulfobacterales bacterium]|nr:class I SAM-dependent methyltransferase [Desulfobacterales bacterium]